MQVMGTSLSTRTMFVIGNKCAWLASIPLTPFFHVETRSRKKCQGYSRTTGTKSGSWLSHTMGNTSPRLQKTAQQLYGLLRCFFFVFLRAVEHKSHNGWTDLDPCAYPSWTQGRHLLPLLEPKRLNDPHRLKRQYLETMEH